MSIRVLTPHVANQIAAGEVIEKPASVVKELVENAIDAGSDMIAIDIQNGGIDSIRISDNGCGIEPEDCETAFLSHATSKIENVDDISHIDTLGFRGEALPSIASVADVTLKTRKSGNDLGTKVHIKYGEKIPSEPISCTEGTTMEVEGLFFKTPARLKFLKTPRVEAGYISDYISRMILSFPEISFSFKNNDKLVYQTFGKGNLKDSIFCVYGQEYINNIVPVEYDDGYVKINGYIGNENLSRPNRSQQSFFLNKRYIASNTISNAIQAAFETRMMVGKFPFAVLNLSISPYEVDVNVHPTKMQVRFSEESRVFNAVYQACKQALLKGYSEAKNDLHDYSPNVSAVDNSGSLADTEFRYGLDLKSTSSYSYNPTPGNDINVFDIHHKTSQFKSPDLLKNAGLDAQPYKIIGSAFVGYWIVEQGERILLIDQHAAHERRLYESIMKNEVTVGSQPLLIPEVKHIDETDIPILQDNRTLINEIGFDFEIKDETNGKNIVIKSIPVINGTQIKASSLFDALEMIRSNKSLTSKEFVKEALIYSSCKHAVKVNESIDYQEIKYLLYQYEKDVPLTCPHGRPVLVSFSKTDIEKMFKRIV